MRTHLWVACSLVLALVAGCGDGNGNGNGNDNAGFEPVPGLYTGETSDGGSIEIEVGSIEAISFDCDGDLIAETFNPGKTIDDDGSFRFSFSDGGRNFEVDGLFTSESSIEGDIDDDDDDCDVAFEAAFGGGIITPSPPTRTPTPVSSGPTVTPTTGPTSTAATPTGTGPTPTGATPTGATPTGPTATATPGDGCPAQLTVEGQGQQANLDTGWTGIAVDQTVVGKGSLSVALDCPNAAPPCGNCTVTGPIASTTIVNNERCITDTSVDCTNGTPNGTCSGGCAFFFGAPLSLSSGGVPVCVQNRVNGQVTGTNNPTTGAGSSQVALISSVFNGLLIDRPCPVCSGTTFGSTGTCSDGPRAGLSCTVDGTSQFFGNTSFDCPPNPGANIGNLNIALNPTTGTSELTPSASTACDSFPFAGRACYCQGQDAFNACTDAVCTADANGVGTCEAGPPSGFCQPAQPFRSCNGDQDCVGSDTCQFELRKCQGGSQAAPTLDLTGPIRRTGTANPANPVMVSTFCVAAVSAPAVNAAAGLPGPGALILPSKNCYDPTCAFP